MPQSALLPQTIRHEAIERVAGGLKFIDTAKGIGIVLVVVGHVWYGLDKQAAANSESLFSKSYVLASTFLMPLFFFLSGHFLNSAMINRAPLAFIRSRVRKLLWPLALWTWIYFVLRMAIGNVAGTPVSFADFPLFPLPPRDHFWFLWALFLCQLLPLVIRPWLVQQELATASWLALGCLTLLTYFALPLTPATAPWLAGAVVHAPYVVLGALYSRIDVVPSTARLTLTAGLILLTGEVMALEIPQSRLSHLVLAAVTTLALVRITQALVLWERASRVVRFVRYLGAMSMVIYVSHVIFTAATRVILARLAVTDMTFNLVAGTVVGIAGPVALYKVARRVRLLRAALF